MATQLATYTTDDVARIVVHSLLLERRRALNPGEQYDGDRDIAKSAGYKTDLTFHDFYARYRRQHIAKRIVHAAPADTWKKLPIVTDSQDGKETEFTKAWKALTTVEEASNGIDEKRSLFYYMTQADKLAGIGEFGGLLLGLADDEENLTQPIKENKAALIKGFLYATPLHQGDLGEPIIETDARNARYGRPRAYRIKLQGAETETEVHWERVIHIAEGAEKSDYLGTPRLEAVFDLLDDLLKVTAGSAEAMYQWMKKNGIITSKDGYSLPEDNALTDKVLEYLHEMTPVLELEGADLKTEGGQTINPSPIIKIIIALISATLGIPQRLLLGSERGELASTTDESTWHEAIVARQTQFAEPVILRPVINRLIYAGVLPEPKEKRYKVIWQPLKTPSPQETAVTNKARADIIHTLEGSKYVDEDEVRELALLPPRKKSGDPVSTEA